MKIGDYSCKYFSSNKTLSAFMADVRRYEVPTTEEEEELVRRYKRGDESAADELINRNLRFLYSLAKIYARNESEVTDYVDEGVIGFKKALKKFDPDRGFKFITYAVWYVRREMNFYLSDTRNMINRSNNGKLGKKIEKVKQAYLSECGMEPTTEQIKELIQTTYGINVREECDLYDVNISSINEELDDDYTMEDDSEYNEHTASENSYNEDIESDYNKSLVESVLSIIPEKQADIVKMIFGIGEYAEPCSYETIGRKYHMAPDAVESLQGKIIEYIRQNSHIVKRYTI